MYSISLLSGVWIVWSLSNDTEGVVRMVPMWRQLLRVCVKGTQGHTQRILWVCISCNIYFCVDITSVTFSFIISFLWPHMLATVVIDFTTLNHWGDSLMQHTPLYYFWLLDITFASWINWKYSFGTIAKYTVYLYSKSLSYTVIRFVLGSYSFSSSPEEGSRGNTLVYSSMHISIRAARYCFEASGAAGWWNQAREHWVPWAPYSAPSCHCQKFFYQCIQGSIFHAPHHHHLFCIHYCPSCFLSIYSSFQIVFAVFLSSVCTYLLLLCHCLSHILLGLANFLLMHPPNLL